MVEIDIEIKNVDWFLVYDGTYIYKIEASEVNTNVSLRYLKPKNNQLVGVKMASDYILS